ncbi:MAG TPA: hypothetical protein VH170_04170 [Chthoniobacterales bacterium]|jgi:lipoate-protein ligase A|nr:hypothetical protein [Chthoniobacterales bacterium]
MTKNLFAALLVYHDIDSRSAAMNMAIDEAILEMATEPTIRFYRWDHPALSFGYFGKFSEVANHEGQREIVRRWTGGGIVFHGYDLTYSLIIPATDPAFGESSMSIYLKVHAAISTTLGARGKNVAALYERGSERDSAVADRRYNKELCFANPVKGDVLLDGQKIAGAAQRRTRRGLLQQGSIQGLDLGQGFEEDFVSALSVNSKTMWLENGIVQRALEIAEQKYATTAWLRRR